MPLERIPGVYFAPLTEADTPPSVPRGRVFGAAALSWLHPLCDRSPASWGWRKSCSRPIQKYRLNWIGSKSKWRRSTRISSRRVPSTKLPRKPNSAPFEGRKERQAVLEKAINAGFRPSMEENIDLYLDWYYSLPAEYVRLGKMLVGNLEGYMARELKAKLGSGEPFAAVEAEFTRLLGMDKAAESRVSGKAGHCDHRTQQGDAQRLPPGM